MQIHSILRPFMTRLQQEIGALSVSVALVGACYWWRYFAQEGFDRLDVAGFLCFGVFALIAGLVVVGLVLWMVIATSERRLTVLPLLTLCLGGVAAIIAPLPLPPAEATFTKYQAAYEQVAQLAQQGKLQPSPSCTHTLGLPPGYDHLSQRCVIPDGSDNEPLATLSFNPPGSWREILYAPTPTALQTSFCYRRGLLEKQLTSGWYICLPYD
jgi:hypothetical protein